MLRKPIRNRSQLLSSRGNTKKSKKRKEKPPWDNTMKDLSLYKLTPEQLERNRELHRPKKDHERILRKIERSKAFIHDVDSTSFYGYDEASASHHSLGRKDAPRKEIYKEDKELRDLLSETDKTFAKMEDIFGDNVFKNKGLSVVTKAPNFRGDTKSITIFESENPSYYDTLSESLVKYPELNPKFNDESISSISGDEGVSIDESIFQTKMNIDHYQDILKKNSCEMHLNSDLTGIESKGKELTELVEEEYSDRSCKNLKGANVDKYLSDGIRTNNKKKGNKSVEKSNVTMSSSVLPTFDDMKCLLESLQSEVSQYEKETGRDNMEELKIPHNLSGYTASLLSMIVRLSRHLNASERQLRAEMAMREEILDMFDDQRTLIDILTNNLLETQKANDALKCELSLQKETCETHHANLKMDFSRLEKRLNSFLADQTSSKEHFPMVEPLQNITNMMMPEWVISNK